MRRLIPLMAAVLGTATEVRASLVFDEAALGDFSDDRLNPTRAVLGIGLNRISGRFGSSPTPDVHDLDYVTFRIPEGMRLESLRVEAASVGGAFAFMAMQAGPIVTIPADWTSINSPLLGWAHFGSATVGLDVLPEMGSSPGSVGFSGPLGPGTYAMWIMELDTSEEHSYSFALEVTGVPAPGTAALAALLGSPRRRRRSQ